MDASLAFVLLLLAGALLLIIGIYGLLPNVRQLPLPRSGAIRIDEKRLYPLAPTAAPPLSPPSEVAAPVIEAPSPVAPLDASSEDAELEFLAEELAEMRETVAALEVEVRRLSARSSVAPETLPEEIAVRFPGSARGSGRSPGV